MYLSMFDIIGISIALVSSILIIALVVYANRVLLRENRELRSRVRRQSKLLRTYRNNAGLELTHE
jgi:type II secretory pathway component PulJ